MVEQSLLCQEEIVIYTQLTLYIMYYKLFPCYTGMNHYNDCHLHYKTTVIIGLNVFPHKYEPHVMLLLLANLIFPLLISSQQHSQSNFE